MSLKRAPKALKCSFLVQYTFLVLNLLINVNAPGSYCYRDWWVLRPSLSVTKPAFTVNDLRCYRIDDQFTSFNSFQVWKKWV
ncbi:hypothetical protein L596_006513 [Steinernema carpocapsae]|uniref:Uncharacterized protein n=1 Tax=Steinernema carpocapsae TaxID=34508 RepID=A0A4U8V2A7_STECR|nr:hypothetical protein L596_006513 [Steinernema carpocapsae]